MNSARSHLRWFVVAVGAYTAICLIAGWGRTSLFLGVGEDGWPAPPAAELIYLIYITCLPLVFWLLIVYAAACKIPRAWGVWTMLLVFFLVLTAIELDHAWFNMSGHHATWREVELFMSEDRRLHYGIRNSDIYWFLRRIAVHVIGLIIALAASGFAMRWKRGERCFPVRLGRVFTAVCVLMMGDILLSGYAVSRGYDQWQAVVDVNPFRLAGLDHLATRAFLYHSEHDTDVEEANRAFEEETRDALHPSGKATEIYHATRIQSERFDVVIVTIEGLNARLIDSTTMPFFTQLSDRSTKLENHYSSGNVTEYGVLGVVYGAPPDFYRGTLTLPWRNQIISAHSPRPGSPYLDQFAREGYHTRLISWEIMSWANLGAYLNNFTEPPFETTDDWKLIPVVSRELKQPGPHLIYLHYNGTHFPYDHGAAYTRFRPEVPSDFDYASLRLMEKAPQITNRYRNCLAELDDWLRSLVGEIDLRHTIVVLTGDHGEEFFEHGRLGHASKLDAPQIHTVALIYAPNRLPRKIDVVTSHADLMPTITDLLGWPMPVRPFGQSLAGDVESGSAIVAMGNRPNPPDRFAAIAAGSKAVFVLGSGDSLHVVQLLDTNDRPLSFSSDPARWQAPFAAAVRLQLRLQTTADSARPSQRMEAQ